MERAFLKGILKRRVKGIDSWIEPEDLAALKAKLVPGPREEGTTGREAGAVAISADIDFILGGATSEPGPAADAPSEGRRPGEAPARRAGQQLAQIVAKASASGLIGAGAGGVDPDADTGNGAAAPAAARRGTVSDRLRTFSLEIARRYACPRVTLVDARGYSLIGADRSEAPLTAVVNMLAHSWMGCQRHLKVEEAGPLAASLGQGYRLVVIPTETALGFIALGLVTQRVLSDAEAAALRGALVGEVARG